MGQFQSPYTGKWYQGPDPQQPDNQLGFREDQGGGVFTSPYTGKSYRLGPGESELFRPRPVAPQAPDPTLEADHGVKMSDYVDLYMAGFRPSGPRP
jgi:hypothetical protein